MKEENYHLLKVKVYGDSQVGKSCLILRFADDTYTEQPIHTIGVDYKDRSIRIHNNTVKFRIYDPEKQLHLQNTIHEKFRDSHHALSFVCYDVTNPTSLSYAKECIEQIEQAEISDNGIKQKLILLGCKNDLENEKRVPDQEAGELAKSFGIKHILASAKNSQNVEEAFKELGLLALQEKGIIAIDKEEKNVSDNITRILENSIKDFYSQNSHHFKTEKEVTQKINKRYKEIGKGDKKFVMLAKNIEKLLQTDSRLSEKEISHFLTEKVFELDEKQQFSISKIGLGWNQFKAKIEKLSQKTELNK